MKEKLLSILMFILLGLVLTAAIAYGIMRVILWVQYKDVPVGEIPYWVLWFMGS